VSSLSDPQADATIANAARMTMNRFNIKTFPSIAIALADSYSTLVDLSFSRAKPDADHPQE